MNTTALLHLEQLQQRTSARPFRERTMMTPKRPIGTCVFTMFRREYSYTPVVHAAHAGIPVDTVKTNKNATTELGKLDFERPLTRHFRHRQEHLTAVTAARKRTKERPSNCLADVRIP
jgi:hypothetical protein